MTVPPDELPAGLAEPLDGTLGPDGLPGVLADWIEERSSAWGALTAALQTAGPFTGSDDSHRLAAPLDRAVATGVTTRLMTAREHAPPGQSARETTVLGFHLYAPGREGVWRLAVPGNPAALRHLFGGPPKADS